jgi:bifunctional DNA-binding transcriptional regulator/antitoxin component of YhaV-PrlF toxin-antitoxin module
MRATLSVSGRGLIALPAKMRKAVGIRPQDSLIAETLITGDKMHFGSFYGQAIGGVEIHSPASLALKLSP